MVTKLPKKNAHKAWCILLNLFCREFRQLWLENWDTINIVSMSDYYPPICIDLICYIYIGVLDHFHL